MGEEWWNEYSELDRAARELRRQARGGSGWRAEVEDAVAHPLESAGSDHLFDDVARAGCAFGDVFGVESVGSKGGCGAVGGAVLWEFGGVWGVNRAWLWGLVYLSQVLRVMFWGSDVD